jgi:NADPH:quinone reductase-like Zn-dependent oxidoreductase
VAHSQEELRRSRARHSRHDKQILSTGSLKDEPMMKALIRDRYGPPEVLEARNIERPAPKEHEVLVQVHAASINDWDWQMLQRPMLPLGFNRPRVRILGSDIAGRVAAVGSGVQRFAVGDEVYGDLSRFGSGGSRGWGGFAEYVCAPEVALVRKPSRMTFEQAAALPQAGQLAVQGLFATGPLRSGQKILINGAGGGVGTIAIQLAKSQDVEVTGVDSAVKFEMMRAIGFDHVIDYMLRPDPRYKNDSFPIRVYALAQSRRNICHCRWRLVPTVPVCNFRMVHSANYKQNRPLDHAEAEPGPAILERSF